MRGLKNGVVLILSALILFSTGSIIKMSGEFYSKSSLLSSESSENNNSTNTIPEIYAEIPVWNIGDSWRYSTELDAAAALPEDDPYWEDADLSQYLTGTTLVVIENITTYNYTGTYIPVYVRTFSGSYEGPAVFPTPEEVDFLLETVEGVLFVEYHRTEYIRVSDLALVEVISEVVIDFEFALGTESILDTVSTVKYNPAYEFFDFPISLNESWSSFHEIEEDWQDSKGFFDAPPATREDEYVFDAVENGTPPHVFQECEETIKINNVDTDGEPVEWMWYCKEIKSAVVWWMADISVNVDAKLSLIEYIPTETVPTNTMNVELNPTFQRLNATLSDIINISITLTDIEGTPISGMNGNLSYCNQDLNWTSDSNGTVLIQLDIGILKDDTTTLYDWGSHGIVIWSGVNITLNVTTIVLNSSAVAEAIALRNEGATLIHKSSEPGLALLREFDQSMRW